MNLIHLCVNDTTDQSSEKKQQFGTGTISSVIQPSSRPPPPFSRRRSANRKSMPFFCSYNFLDILIVFFSYLQSGVCGLDVPGCHSILHREDFISEIQNARLSSNSFKTFMLFGGRRLD